MVYMADINRTNKKKQGQIIAKERIEILFREADLVFLEDQKLANRYVELARKIGMKLNVSIPKHLKCKFCKKCGHFLVFGINAKQRLISNEKIVVFTCLDCGFERRVPYIK
jgi:ribonuclease P protein subunit RPR2